MHAQTKLAGLALTGALIGALASCSAIIGVKDLTYDPNATTSDGGGSDAPGGGDGTTPDAPTGDGGVDGTACNADLQTNKDNCGRCGHGCVGGGCTAGKCEAVDLATAQDEPSALAIDETYVYFTNTGTNAIVRVAKAGGQPEKIADMVAASGITVDGPTLYFAGNVGAGGVTKCQAASCTATKMQISSTGYVRHLAASAGTIFFATESDVRRVQADGTAEKVLGAATQPFAVAVDQTHVYFSSLQPQIQRAPINGGPQTDVGMKDNADNVSFIALDQDKVYWTYSDNSDVGHTTAALKANVQTLTTFGTGGKLTTGIAVDAANVYWLDAGTFNGNTPNFDGKLVTCPKVGCPASGPTELASNAKLGGPVVLDAAAIYWVEYGGSAGANGRIRKVAKP